jgi:signal transduction histidine kinase
MHQKIKILVLLLCTLAFVNPFLQAQKGLADSVEKILQQPLTDSARMTNMIKMAMYYEPVDSAKAHRLYRDARNYATQKKDSLFIARSLRFEAFFYNQQGGIARAISNLNTAILLVGKNTAVKYKTEYSKCLTDMGNYYNSANDFTKALEYYLKGITLKEQMGKPVMSDYVNISMMYQKMHEKNEQKKWVDKAMQIARQQGKKEDLFNAYLYKAQYYTADSDYVTAKKMVDTARLLMPPEMQHYSSKSAVLYTNMSSYYIIAANTFKNVKMYDSAVFYFNKAYEILKANNDVHIMIEPQLKMGYIKILQKKYAEAEPILLTALADSKKATDVKRQLEAYESLSRLYAETQRYQQAYGYYKIFHQLDDSIAGLDKAKYNLELEEKYEVEKKETVIKNLEVEKKLQHLQLKEKNVLNFILIGSLLMALLVGLLLYRNYKQKQQLQQQQISELVTERKLFTTEAILKGEEQERARLAKDLHDGLSGMLSGVKFSLQNMQGNLIMTPDNQQSFARSLDMLDNSITEMRRVAHNMLPEGLVRYGLDVALKDYVTEINKTGVVTVVYQSMGMENAGIEQTVAISIYRVVQELLNNVIKHAAASTVLVQILKEAGKLIINVEDNGKGFDTDLIESAAGMGWKNIRSRIELLNGKIDIQSGAGKGTAVNIEMNII